MIMLTRLGGSQFALNPDLIERIDSAPDTVIALIDGKKYVVAESLHVVSEMIRDYRSDILVRATQMAVTAEEAGQERDQLAAVLNIHGGS